MGKYLLRMYEEKEQWYPKRYFLKNYYFEIEIEDGLDNYYKYQIAKEKYPNLKYGGYIPLKDKLPQGWKKMVGTLTAPNGYYWASNGKSFFDKEIQRALIKE